MEIISQIKYQVSSQFATTWVQAQVYWYYNKPLFKVTEFNSTVFEVVKAYHEDLLLALGQKNHVLSIISSLPSKCPPAGSTEVRLLAFLVLPLKKKIWRPTGTTTIANVFCYVFVHV